MNAATKQQDYWKSLLGFYSKQNEGRLTRLGVFEGETDYWLENGLPFTGIDMDVRGGIPVIQIMLGEFTHTVKNVRILKVYLTLEGDEDGIDVTDAEGKTAILRFG